MTEASELIQSPFGRVWPARQSQPLPAVDVRTIGLRMLRLFISLLRFQRVGDRPDQTIEFRVPIENIHIEQPDNIKDLKFPGFGFIGGRGLNDAIGLGAGKPIEDTLHVFGRDTILVQLGEYTESFTVEAWGSQRAERRSLIAGLAAALRSSEESYSIRLVIAEYYNQIVEFTLDGTQPIDDPDSVRGRRRGHLFVTMRLPEVVLVNCNTMQPMVALASCDTDADVSASVYVAVATTE